MPRQLGLPESEAFAAQHFTELCNEYTVFERTGYFGVQTTKLEEFRDLVAKESCDRGGGIVRMTLILGAHAIRHAAASNK
jgi:hypothetical protein